MIHIEFLDQLYKRKHEEEIKLEAARKQLNYPLPSDEEGGLLTQLYRERFDKSNHALCLIQAIIVLYLHIHQKN